MQNIQIFISYGTQISEFFMRNNIQYVLDVFIPTSLFHVFKTTFLICISEDHLIYKLINKQKSVLFPYLHLLLNTSLLFESHRMSLIISRIALI